MFKLLLICVVIFHNGAAWDYQPWYTGGSSGHYRQVRTSMPVLGTQYSQQYPYFPWSEHPAPVPFLPVLPLVLMPMVPLPFESWGQMYSHTMKPYFPKPSHHGRPPYDYNKSDSKPDDCPTPMVRNGTVLIEKTVDGTVVAGGNATVGSIATFTCDTGFTLNGSDTVTCTENSTWSSEIPLCKYKPISNICNLSCTTESCPEGWSLHLGRCYHTNWSPLNWTDAMDYCKINNSVLAEPVTQDQLGFFAFSFLIWVGGRFSHVDQVWIWVTSKTIPNYTLVDNIHGVGDCLKFEGYTIYKSLCGSKQASLCEKCC